MKLGCFAILTKATARERNRGQRGQRWRVFDRLRSPSIAFDRLRSPSFATEKSLADRNRTGDQLMIANPLQSTALPTELQRGAHRRAGNRTRGSTMATLNFTTKPLAVLDAGMPAVCAFPLLKPANYLRFLRFGNVETRRGRRVVKPQANCTSPAPLGAFKRYPKAKATDPRPHKTAERVARAISLSGNRTPVTRVTGGYTDHYTNKDDDCHQRKLVGALASSAHTNLVCGARAGGV